MASAIANTVQPTSVIGDSPKASQSQPLAGVTSTGHCAIRYHQSNTRPHTTAAAAAIAAKDPNVPRSHRTGLIPCTQVYRKLPVSNSRVTHGSPPNSAASAGTASSRCAVSPAKNAACPELPPVNWSTSA